MGADLEEEHLEMCCRFAFAEQECCHSMSFFALSTL